MSLVTGSANVSLDMVSAQKAPFIAGLVAGEAIHAGAMCYIKSDGDVFECLGTSGSAASCPFGIAPRQYNTDEAVTLFGEGTRFQYSSGLTPGARLYLNVSVAGAYDTAATLGDKVGVLAAVNATDVIVIRADAIPVPEI
jgi:hypothetical protein